MRAIDRVRSAVVAAGISVVAIAPATANDIFLKLPGVTGTVTRAAFAGDIQLTAYSQGFTDPATISTGGGSGAGRTSCGDINITKAVDSTSPEFLQYVARGVALPSVTIYFLGSVNGANPANVPYTIALSNVRVTAISQGDTLSHTSGLGITENISMVAEKFQFTYRSVNPDGSVGKTESFSWNCATNSTT